MRARLLLSYHYHREVALASAFPGLTPSAATWPDILIDSGGYSAANAGAQVEVAQYARYLLTNAPHVSAYANLDVVGDAAATLANQRRLEEEYDLHPLPVFHVGEPWGYLERYLERYPYIALGGMVQHLLKRSRANGEALLLPWLVRCFKLAREVGAVYHGFGVTAWRLLSSFPWYSIDSTGWKRSERFAEVNLFDQRAGQRRCIVLREANSTHKAATALRDLGVHVTDVLHVPQGAHDTALYLGVASGALEERYLRRRFGPQVRRDAPEGGTPEGAPAWEPGLRYYLACTLSDYPMIASSLARLNSLPTSPTRPA